MVVRHEMEQRVVAAPTPAPPPAPLPAQPFEAHDATPRVAPAHLLASPTAPPPVPPPHTPPSALASRRRVVEAEEVTEMGPELEHAQGAVPSTVSLTEHAQAASRHATTQRPATAPVTARETGYYITVTGGGACYHLTPKCSGLLQADVRPVASTGGRRLCNICAGVNAKPLIRAPSAALMSARHVYYTTRTGKKYHTDRCCSGLRSANELFEVTSRPELDACNLCCRR
jgi:hypothetical protein